MPTYHIIDGRLVATAPTPLPSEREIRAYEQARAALVAEADANPNADPGDLLRRHAVPGNENWVNPTTPAPTAGQTGGITRDSFRQVRDAMRRVADDAQVNHIWVDHYGFRSLEAWAHNTTPNEGTTQAFVDQAIGPDLTGVTIRQQGEHLVGPLVNQQTLEDIRAYGEGVNNLITDNVTQDLNINPDPGFAARVDATTPVVENAIGGVAADNIIRDIDAEIDRRTATLRPFVLETAATEWGRILTGTQLPVPRGHVGVDYAIGTDETAIGLTNTTHVTLGAGLPQYRGTGERYPVYFDRIVTPRIGGARNIPKPGGGYDHVPAGQPAPMYGPTDTRRAQGGTNYCLISVQDRPDRFDGMSISGPYIGMGTVDVARLSEEQLDWLEQNIELVDRDDRDRLNDMIYWARCGTIIGGAALTGDGVLSTTTMTGTAGFPYTAAAANTITNAGTITTFTGTGMATLQPTRPIEQITLDFPVDDGGGDPEEDLMGPEVLELWDRLEDEEQL